MFEMIFRIPKKIGFTIVAALLITIFLLELSYGGSSIPGLYFIPIILASIIFSSTQGFIVVMLSVIFSAMVDFRLVKDLSNMMTKTMIFSFSATIVFIAGAELKRYIGLLRYKSNIIEDMNRDIVYAFVQAIEAKDPYLNNHSKNVSYYAREIALHLQLPLEEVTNIYWSGVLHDIGKIGVSENILNKKTRLSENDWQQIKRHPVTGAEILKSIPSFDKMVPYVLYHHQYYNGQGYPGILKEEQIPIGARILAVADAYDAMTSNRVYRKSMSKDEAISELLKCAGEQFDPYIIREFVRILENPKWEKTAEVAS